MNYEFYTFLTPEASRAVLDYIDWRNRTSKGEGARRANQLEKQHVTSQNGYLFVGRTVPKAYLTTKNEKEREKLRKLNVGSILAIYQRLDEEARASAGYGDYNLIRSHNMRRFCNTTLLSEHAAIFFVDFLLGHKLDATHEAYYRADPMSLRDEYEKYIPHLTIQKEVDVSETAEWRKIVAENEKLTKIAAETSVERNEIVELRKEIQELYKLIDTLTPEIDLDSEVTEDDKKNMQEW